MKENEPEESKNITQLEDFERIWAQHVRAEAELDELIDAAAAAEPMTARATALRAEMIDRARESAEAEERRLGEGRGVATWSVTEGARRTVSAELSAALRIPEISMRALIAESRVIMHELPVTRCALTAGRISDRHAQKIIDHALSLPESARDEFERAVIPVAQTQTVAIRPERMLYTPAHQCGHALGGRCGHPGDGRRDRSRVHPDGAVRQFGAGSLEWISPTGHRYRTDSGVKLSA